MGGNAYEIMVGGAGLSKEIESFLVEIGFPITIGYGTTETGPMISYSDWHDFVRALAVRWLRTWRLRC